MDRARVGQVLRQTLEDLAEEIASEEREEWLVTRAEGNDEVEEGAEEEWWADIQQTLDELMLGKTGWLNARRPDGQIQRAHTPEFYIDWQPAIVQIRVAKQLVDNLSKVPDRLLNIPSLLLSEKPSRECASYLEEAARCYLYGFHRASIALSRSAVESALRDKLQSPITNLSDQIRAAREQRLLSKDGHEAALNVLRRGNGVLHRGEVAVDATTQQVLRDARWTVEELYGGLDRRRPLWNDV